MKTIDDSVWNTSVKWKKKRNAMQCNARKENLMTNVNKCMLKEMESYWTWRANKCFNIKIHFIFIAKREREKKKGIERIIQIYLSLKEQIYDFQKINQKLILWSIQLIDLLPQFKA